MTVPAHKYPLPSARTDPTNSTPATASSRTPVRMFGANDSSNNLGFTTMLAQSVRHQIRSLNGHRHEIIAAVAASGLFRTE